MLCPCISMPTNFNTFPASQIGGDNYRSFLVSISSVAVMIGEVTVGYLPGGLDVASVHIFQHEVGV